MSVQSPATSEIRYSVLAELEIIETSTEFGRSPQAFRLLAYVVRQCLDGNTESIKESVIGVEVFGRDTGYDSRADPIVRTEARRLRHKLDTYYARAGTRPVRITVPTGTYIPTFDRRPPVVEFSVEPAPDPHKRRPVAAATILLVVAVLGAIAYFVARRPSRMATANTTLLVAPFANFSEDKDAEYFAGGLTEELIDALSNVPGLRVVARVSSPRWTDKDLDIQNLRQLGINNVVEGSVRKEGKRARISVRLVDARNGSELWAHEYDRDIQDSIVTEQDIASAVASTLKLRLVANPRTTSGKALIPDAYDAYLNGRYNWRQYDAASAAKGIAYLQRSLTIDPSFAPAYVALAGCYGTEVIYSRIPPSEGYVKVREMSLKALALDESLAEAHTLLAGTYAWNDWDWSRAEQEYRRALQLEPQSVIAHQYYASFLGVLGRKTEAEAQMREAIRLDPLDNLVQWGEAQLMHWRGENRQAEALLHKIASTDPQFGMTTQLLAEVEWALGKNTEAREVLEAYLAKHPADALQLGELGYTLAKTGRTKEATDILRRLEDESRQSVVPRQALAIIYLGLGENDQAIHELWNAADARTLRAPSLRVEPIYAGLQKNPQWADLLRHVHLQ